ncbi:MAG: sigma-70 family RNA polymerase sigma factor, partial [Bacteroidota bacterium]|nr:sigma-70 family RNA polymerase sigma factor [Bacteroidota bacterium]
MNERSHLDDEKILIQRLRNGNTEALGALYVRYKSALYRFILRMVNDADSANDVVQETFLKVQSASSSLEHPKTFRAWIFRIARNEALGMLRRTKKKTIDADEVWSDETPHEMLVQEETEEIVRRFLHALKPEYREVLLLREYEQFSYAEIASITGTT